MTTSRKSNDAKPIHAHNVMRRAGVTDPTGTSYYAIQFDNELKRRFNKAMAAIYNRLVAGKVVALQEMDDDDEDMLIAFGIWLAAFLNKEVLTGRVYDGSKFSGYDRWSDYFMEIGYSKGVQHGAEELMGVGGYSPADVGAYTDTGSSFHASRLEMVNIKAFEEIASKSSAFQHKATALLADGIAMGKTKRAVTSQIREVFEKTVLKSSPLIAFAEMVRAHHRGMVGTFRAAGVEKVEVMAEWVTAGDRRVCPTCSSMEGRIYTLDEIEPLIPAHPACRCAIRLVRGT